MRYQLINSAHSKSQSLCKVHKFISGENARSVEFQDLHGVCLPSFGRQQVLQWVHEQSWILLQDVIVLLLQLWR